MRILEVTVPAEADGRKLKYFVRGSLGLSYRQYSALKQAEGLSLNGRPARANDLLRAGDLLVARLPEDAGRGVEPEDGPVRVAWEDEDVLVIDKTAPLPCQCSPKQSGGTLENRLARLYGPDFLFRPVNRLDRGTSGLMAAAKNAHACQRLQRQLHTPEFIREYLAVVEGELSGEGVVDLPIAKESAATVRRVVDSQRGQPAVTHYRALERHGGFTLVRLRLETGRTHQIRVHMAALGHPVAGDFLYGRELPQLPGRFALHSTFISFLHPITGREVSLESPLPAELRLWENEGTGETGNTAGAPPPRPRQGE